MDRMFIDIDLSNQSIQKEPFKLMDGDYVQLFSILDLRLNVVQIAGSVVRPGRYDIGDSLSLSQLVIKADSLLGDAYLDRVDIVRIKPDQTEELIKLNLGKAINGDLANDIKLKSLDKVRVYSMTEMDPQKFVSIKGNVKRSGQYRLLKNMNMYDLIFQAAGGFIDQEFKNTTYLKRAELIRYDNELNKKELITFNLEELLESGNSDIILKPNDAIRIYSLEEIEGSTKFASIKGFVKKPGSYELFEKNMTIYDLVFKAGGFEDLIYKSNTYLERADLIRFDEDRVNKRVIPFNLGELLKNKNYKNNFTLIPGDEIRIYSKKIFNEEKSITIVGSIKNPGQYIYKTEMNLTDLILESGGVVEDVSKYRVEIARVDPNSVDKDIFAESMTFEINQKYDVISGLTNQIDKNENILLFPNDYISIKPDPYYGMQKRVNVKGAVFYPGNYVILSPKETIFDVLNRAGGLRPNAFAKGAKFLRDGKSINIDLTKIMKRRSSRNNFKLIENDEIQVPESKNIVEVSGEVNAPGFYKYVRGGRVNDFIKEAGGFNQDAMKSNVFISFPNGKSRKYSRWLSNPKVLDGSVITIGKKPDEEPFNRTEYLTDLTSIFANIAQAVSMIIIAQR